MPIKYVPYFPTTIEGQAVLDNVTRTRRVLRYRDNERVYDRIKRGLPLFEVTRQETVGEADKAKDNLLLRGDCLSACAFLKERGMTIDLVYIDPPFASGADYAKKVYLRRHPGKAQEVANAEAELESDELRAFEEKMYGDIWNKEDYLNWMFENLQAIKSVMSDTASIYVHLDWHIGHYVKIMMDEVFGEDFFLNEIIWERTYGAGSSKAVAKKLPQNTDSIFIYTRSGEFTLNKPTKSYSKGAIKRYDKVDEQGRRFKWANLRTYSQARLEKMLSEGEAKFNEGARDPVYKVYLDEDKGVLVSNLWNDLAPIGTFAEERLDYSTQKPEALLERIIQTSSDDGMVVADFFGGSGVTAKVAHDLGRRFVHVDVGVNSLQTARDRLKAAGAAFEVCEIQDGVSLFRNPVQTMDKLKSLILGMKNEDSLHEFWEGAIQDSKLGLVPVYLPNLLDHTTKVLDVPLMNRILRQAIPELPDGVKQVIVYYVDMDDPQAIKKFMAEENPTDIEVELRDLKEVLDSVVLNDEVQYEMRAGSGVYEVEITRLVSDRLHGKIDEYNTKKGLSESRRSKELFDEEDGVENEEGEADDKPTKKSKFKPIQISDDGLELIEMVSLDCTAAEGEWHSDVEIKIDKKSFVVRDGVKSKTFWDGKIQSSQKPLRLKVRNIAGDESVIMLVAV